MPARTNERRAAGMGQRAGRVGGVHDDRVRTSGASAASTSSNAPAVGGVRVVDLVGDGEVGEDPAPAAAPGARRSMRATSAGDVARRGADAVHPGVDLEVDADGPRRRACARASIASSVVTVGVSPWATIVAACSGGCSLSTRIGASIPARAAPRPRRSSATHSPSHPASQGGGADGDGAVPVRRRPSPPPRHPPARRPCAARRRCGRAASRSISAHAHRVRPVTRSRQAPPSTSGRASTRSPATSPVGGPDGERPRRAIHAPAAAASERIETGREQGADDARQHVAGAGGGQAGVAVGDDQHVAAGRGDDGGRTLEQHDARAGRRPAGGRPASRSAAGALPGEQPVLAVVRREHGGRRAPVQRPGAAPSASHARANRPSPSTTTRHGRRRRRGPRRRPPCRLPTEAGPDDEGVEAVEVVEDAGSPSRTPAARRRTTSLRRRAVGARATTARPCPLPARIAAADARWAAPVMPGLPATTRTARDHLCAVGGARPPPPGDVARPRRAGRRARRCRGRCRRPRRRPASVAPGAEEQPRLERGERHRAVGGEHAAAGFAR